MPLSTFLGRALRRLRTNLRHGLLAALILAAPCAAAQENGALPWKEGATFTRTSVDDDIKSVLRALLSANGLSVIFRPGV